MAEEFKEEEGDAPAAAEGMPPTDGPANSAAAPSSTDIDDLFSEYDSGTKVSEPNADTAQPGGDEIENLLGELAAQEREKQHAGELDARNCQIADVTLERSNIERERDGWKGAAEQSQTALNEVNCEIH